MRGAAHSGRLEGRGHMGRVVQTVLWVVVFAFVIILVVSAFVAVVTSADPSWDTPR